MRKRAFTEEQIAAALNRVDRGASVRTVCAEFKTSSTTLRRWLRRYGPSPAERVRRLRSLEADVKRLEATVRDLSVGARLVGTVLRRIMPGPARRRAEVKLLRDRFGLSERKACHLLGWPRSSNRYVSRPQEPDELRRRIRELAAANPDSGYRALWHLLKAEGIDVNHKRVYRIYREEGLHLDRKPLESGRGKEDGEGGASQPAPRGHERSGPNGSDRTRASA